MSIITHWNNNGHKSFNKYKIQGKIKDLEQTLLQLSN